MLGISGREVEALTTRLAPQARRGGETEGDMLVLVHEMVTRSTQRPGDIDYIVDTTLPRWRASEHEHDRDEQRRHRDLQHLPVHGASLSVETSGPHLY